MKKIRNISYAVAAFMATTATSCKKQIEEYNPSSTTAEATWTTPAGFITNVNAAYWDIHNWYGVEDGALMTEGGTDLWYNSGRASYANGLTRYEGLTPSLGTNRTSWIPTWRSINLCNAGIGRIDQAGFTDPVEKNKRLAELRFMRALYYYHVVEQWGGVMLRTTETTGAELTATRSTPEEFYDVIISDLLFAKDNLPISWGATVSTEYSRASKKSALGLLARVYLTRAYYSTGADATAYFTKAKDVALEVINNKTALGTDTWLTYADLWKPANNKLNKESLFTISYSATNPTYNVNSAANRMYKWYVTSYNGKPGLVRSLDYGYDNETRFMPTWHLLDLYGDTTIDARYNASFQENWYCNTKGYTWTTGDAATYLKAASVVGKKIDTATLSMQISKEVIANKATTPVVTFDRNDIYVNPVPGQPAKIVAGTVLSAYYPACKKFADPNRATATTSPGYNDIFVIRLAEMYMIAAEAFFKLDDKNSAATYINFLRKRAAKPGQEGAMQIGASDVTMQFILDERAREFAGEFQRWYDLKRVFRGDDFASYITFYNPDITAVTKFNRLRPIPQTEMDALLNAGDFKQNEGYQ